MSFEQAVAKLLPVEAGFVDDPSDSGGATIWGITERTARANGYHGPMREMPQAEAVRIYRAQYWDLIRLDEVAHLSPAIADEVFECGVNCGQGVAVSFLQRSLNALNLRGTIYGDLVTDGIMGPMTLGALRSYMGNRGPEGQRVLLTMLNSLQGARYVELAERREKDERFIYGWFRARVAL